jgi:exopolysaccharide biosynthesis polyprenyl glycosylphosphotransferase
VIRRHSLALWVLLVSADIVSALGVFAIVAALRFDFGFGKGIWADVLIEPWIFATLYATGWAAVLWLRGLYRLRARWSWRREAADIVTAAALMALGTFAVLFIARLDDVSRLFLALLFPAQAAATVALRLFLRSWFATIRRRGANARFVLVVGAGEAAQQFADRIESHPELGLRVIGHLREPGTEDERLRRPDLGVLEDLESILHTRVIDEVAICLPMSSWDLIEPISYLCQEEGRIVRLPLDGIGPTLAQGRFEEFLGRPVLSFVRGPDRAVALAAKRLLDIALSIAGLVVLSPLLLGVWLWIRQRDGSPVFFKQVRIGVHGRPFTMFKFRTMVHDAEERLPEVEQLNYVKGVSFKVRDDPRVTSGGRFLRRSGIDELPQLWNVLRGEMSIVGPRPQQAPEIDRYDPWHRRRLSMKPGITGLWQVRARSSESDFDRWVEIDLEYIDRWSLWLDLKIMLRTIPAMVLQEGQ